MSKAKKTKPGSMKIEIPDETLIDTPAWRERSSHFSLLQAKAKIVMIGDSITNNAEWSELFPKVSIVNRGIPGDTTYGVLRRMDSILSLKPKLAFIMLGINDIYADRPVDRILNDYIAIIERLQESNISPVIQSTLFVSKKQPRHQVINREVQKLNDSLEGYATEHKLLFINLNQSLSDDHRLRKELTSDGIHINGEGYQIWKCKISGYVTGR
ncbi:MAG TPA: GDSL-type esterase/lipase family protein [Methylobacter sp.]